MAFDFWFLVTLLGDVRAWILFMFLLAMYLSYSQTKGHRRWARAALVLVILSVGITGVAVEALKEAFDVPRICDPATNPYCPTNSAFPSGHTAVAFAGFGALYLTTRRHRQRWMWFFILPALVGTSRLVLGVHTFADVLGGAVVGIIFSIAVFYFLRGKLSWFSVSKAKRKK